MSSPDDVFRQIERDREVREREIRLLGNLARGSSNKSEQDALFRSAILLTYAHLEGFCKFALLAYAAAVNAMRLKCSDATFTIVAASLTNVFGALRNVQSRHPAFASGLPNDAKLHLLAREAEFIEKFNSVIESIVELPDDVVDTESNLSPIILKKNLYKLGMDYAVPEREGAQLNQLLGIRNAIAHGDILKIPKGKEVQDYVELAFRTMSFVQLEIHRALKDKIYLRSAGHSTNGT